MQVTRKRKRRAFTGYQALFFFSCCSSGGLRERHRAATSSAGWRFLNHYPAAIFQHELFSPCFIVTTITLLTTPNAIASAIVFPCSIPNRFPGFSTIIQHSPADAYHATVAARCHDAVLAARRWYVCFFQQAPSPTLRPPANRRLRRFSSRYRLLYCHCWHAGHFRRRRLS